MAIIQLFAYGSFCEGMVHYKKIARFAQSSKRGRIVGRSFVLKSGYPVILDEPCSVIEGQIFTFEPSSILTALLDEFHGVNRDDPSKSLYFRKEVGASVDFGVSADIHSTSVYFLNPSKLPMDAQEIEYAEWVKRIQRDPPLADRLTEKQKTYIRKLGTATGRENIPIDLVLYRELIKLDLIVDKGRRLALSKLGQEILRYIE